MGGNIIESVTLEIWDLKTSKNSNTAKTESMTLEISDLTSSENANTPHKKPHCPHKISKRAIKIS